MFKSLHSKHVESIKSDSTHLERNDAEAVVVNNNIGIQNNTNSTNDHQIQTNDDEDSNSFYAKAYETYGSNSNESVSGKESIYEDEKQRDIYRFNYSDDSNDNVQSISFDDDEDGHHQHSSKHLNNGIPLQNDKQINDNDNGDDINSNNNHSDDDSLLVVNTVALNYDMGISNETKICCSLCRRNKLYKCIVKTCCNGFCCCCKRQNDVDDDGLQDKPTNEELLIMAFLTSLAFAVCEAIGAYFANSQSMMGDAIAMTVDSFSYGFNLVAEQWKNKLQMDLRKEELNYFEQEHYQDVNDENVNGESSWKEEDQVDGSMEMQNLKLRPPTPKEYKTTMSRRTSHLQTFRQNQELKFKKCKLFLELVPPVISVIILMTLTSIMLKQSIEVLKLNFDESDDDNVQSNVDSPNVNLMFGFSVFNLMIDVVNVCFFASADHMFGYDTKDDCSDGDYFEDSHESHTNSHSWDSYNDDDDGDKQRIELVEQNRNRLDSSHSQKKNGVHKKERRRKRDSIGLYNHLASNSMDENELSPKQNVNGNNGHKNNEDQIESNDHLVNHQSHFEEKRNLNMCSAYTHVFADTIRSIAVLIASILAKFLPSVSAEEADSSAAVAVSVIILFALLPLFDGLKSTVVELLAIRREERSRKYDFHIDDGLGENGSKDSENNEIVFV